MYAKNCSSKWGVEKIASVPSPFVFMMCVGLRAVSWVPALFVYLFYNFIEWARLTLERNADDIDKEETVEELSSKMSGLDLLDLMDLVDLVECSLPPEISSRWCFDEVMLRDERHPVATDDPSLDVFFFCC